MSTAPTAPVAERKLHVTKVHDIELQDHYFWLRERESPKVLEHLKKEKAFHEHLTADTLPLKETIFQEFKARLKETDESAHFTRDNYEYYSRTEEGKEYRVYCRKAIDDAAAAEEILLDLNNEHKEHEYRMMWNYKISPDHSKLAYTMDFTGSETFTCFVKDLSNNTLLPKQIKDTHASLEWSADGNYLYFDKDDDTKRPFQIWRTALAEMDESKDELLFEELDGKYEMSFSKTNNGRYVIVASRSGCRASIRAIDAHDNAAKPFVIVDRDESDHLCEVDHWSASEDDKGVFFILSNRDGALNFALHYCPVDDVDSWKSVIPYDEAVYMQSLIAFKSHLALFERANGLKRIRIVDLSNFPNKPITDADLHVVPFDEEVHTVSTMSEQSFDGPLRFVYSSLVTPDTTFELELTTKEMKKTKQVEVPNFDASKYVSERVWATSHDGVQVPISVIRAKDAPDGPKKLHLYGYGSYGLCKDPRFDSKVFSLLDRGFVYAIAHIRGSSIMGHTWYLDGKFFHKKNTFLDFIACADELVKRGVTQHNMMSIEGRSAGGLLVGAVLNMKPSVCKVALNTVGFVDVINTMLDASIPLTVLEYDEWGNPNQKDYFDYMLSYSPYDNVQKTEYPHMLCKAGLNDPRVQYWEPSKYVAKLRHLNPEHKNVIAFDIHTGAGHFGSSGRYAHLEEYASELAFVIHFLDK